MPDIVLSRPAPAAADERHPATIRILHWLMAAGFIVLWASGWLMRNAMADDSPLQETVYDVHKSVGVALVGLFAVRILVRLTCPTPAPPAGIPPREAALARLGHAGLHLLIAAGLATGWALTDFGGHGVVFFGIPMPQVFPVTESLWGVALDPLVSDVHAWIVYGLLALVAVHVAAVVRHRVRHGHDLMPRITPFARRR